MRLLWHSNAPWHGSGYGVQTGLHVPRIQAQGHDMAISCNWGIENGIMSWPGPRGEIPCYPKGVADDSQDILPAHAAHHHADAIITLYDAWTINPEPLKGRWIPYFPVDMEPIPDRITDRIRHGLVRVAMSRFGQQETQNKGLSCEYVPHAYAADEYYPDPDQRAQAQAYLESDGKFVVGVVAANKGTHGAPHRKSFVQILQGFKEFHKQHSDAILYMHTFGRSSMGGLDIEGLCRHFDLAPGSVLVADAYLVHIGFPVEMMRGLYNAFDVLLSPSMGEGFGIPILEAQACGTPVITGDWTAMSELTKTGYAIPREDAFPYYWPTYENEYIVHPEAVTDALNQAYEWRYDRATVAAKMVEYEADTVCETYWPAILSQAEQLLAPHSGPNREQRRAMSRRKVAGRA